ncbi:hypothetical protein LN050_09910 [Comamonadaceae bacterium M7527]|nr:hypothetical protein LN050_09910 [Comamonadaceae bacterium M7527]
MPVAKPSLSKKKPCLVCMRIRKFLYVAAIILAVMWLKPEWRLPPGYNYSAILGDLFVAAFVIVFAYKWWEHKRDIKANGDTQEERFEKLRERTNKIVAELDESADSAAPTSPAKPPEAQAGSANVAHSGERSNNA